MQPLSEQLLYRQLIQIGKVARAAPNSPLRRDTFIDDTLLPQVGRFVRKVGRPRQEWTTGVMKAGAQKFGSDAIYQSKLRGYDAKQWKRELDERFRHK